jgi:outer membrane receptor protein involved in Fe transport
VKTSNWGLSYSKRLNRPDSDELNPFPEYTNPREAEVGNPNLKPEQIHSIELGYEYKNNSISFAPAIYYRYMYDAFTEITSYINDTILLTSFDNLSSEQSAGLELILTWNLNKKLNLNFSSNMYYNTIDANNLGYLSKSLISSDTKLASSFNITPTTKLQINANYRSAMLTSQGQSLPVFF